MNTGCANTLLVLDLMMRLTIFLNNLYELLLTFFCTSFFPTRTIPQQFYVVKIKLIILTLASSTILSQQLQIMQLIYKCVK